MASEPAPVPSRGGGFLFNVNVVFFATIAEYAVAFLTIVTIARLLGPAGRGVTALYQSTVQFAFALLSFGIAAATVYFVSRRDLAPRAMLEVAASVTLAAALVTAGGVGAIALLGGRVDTGGVPYGLASIAVPALIQLYALDAVLRAEGRFLAMSLLEMLMPVAVLAGLIGLELAGGLTVSGAVYTWSLAALLPLPAGYVLVGRDAWPRQPAPLARLRQTLAFGAVSQLANLLQILNYRLDSYLILLFVNAAGVGLYAVDISLSEGMWFVANSVAIVLLTDLTAGGPDHAARRTPVVCRNTLLVTAVLAVAAGAASPLAIPLLFGESFRGAVVPFLLLLPGTVALAGTKILASYVFSRGKPGINAAIAAATLGLTVVLDLALIPLFAVEGAAAGASVAYAASLALTALAYRRLSGNAIGEALLPRPGDRALYLSAGRAALARLRRA